jgi:hypothetical protein
MVFTDESFAAFHVIFNHIEHTMRKVIDMNMFQSIWTDCEGRPIMVRAQQDVNEFLTLLFFRM